jgi:hypothetical protein
MGWRLFFIGGINQNALWGECPRNKRGYFSALGSAFGDQQTCFLLFQRRQIMLNKTPISGRTISKIITALTTRKIATLMVQGTLLSITITTTIMATVTAMAKVMGIIRAINGYLALTIEKVADKTCECAMKH